MIPTPVPESWYWRHGIGTRDGDVRHHGSLAEGSDCGLLAGLLHDPEASTVRASETYHARRCQLCELRR